MKVTAVFTKLVRHTMLAAPLALIPAVSNVLLPAVGIHGVQIDAVYAQEEKQKPKHKTRKTPALRETVFKKLAVVQQLIPHQIWTRVCFNQSMLRLK